MKRQQTCPVSSKLPRRQRISFPQAVNDQSDRMAVTLMIDAIELKRYTRGDKHAMFKLVTEGQVSKKFGYPMVLNITLGGGVSIVSLGNDGFEPAVGFAKCNIEDTFNRDFGLRKAMLNALDQYKEINRL